MRRLGGEHPGVAPSGRAFARDGVRERPAVALELDRLVRPCGADESVAVLEIENLLRRGRPVLLDQLPLLHQQRHSGVELLFRELVGICDAETRLGLAQVQRRVRDRDRIVVRGDDSLVGRVVDRAPAGRRDLELGGVVQQHIGAPLQRDSVMHAVDRVVGRILEVRLEVGPVWNQLFIHRPDVAAVDQPQVRVTRGRDHVPLPAATLLHQADHFVRRARGLGVDLAAGSVLKRLLPGVIDVAFPRDQVQRTLAIAHLVQWFQRRGRRHPVLGAGAGVAASASGRQQDRDRDHSSKLHGFLPPLVEHVRVLRRPGQPHGPALEFLGVS